MGKEQMCYRIESKAGSMSGKSTLRQSLHADCRTHAALKQCTDSGELVVAPYFFRPPLQEGQEGLLSKFILARWLFESKTKLLLFKIRDSLLCDAVP